MPSSTVSNNALIILLIAFVCAAMKQRCPLCSFRHIYAVCSFPIVQLVYDGPKSKIFDIAPIAGRSGYFLVRAKDQYGNATSLGLNETLEATCSDKNLKIVTQDMYDAGVSLPSKS